MGDKNRHQRVIDMQRMSDQQVASIDLLRADAIRRQDAAFRGAMLDALEAGRERLPTASDYCDDVGVGRRRF
jgi:hypothetical protein